MDKSEKLYCLGRESTRNKSVELRLNDTEEISVNLNPFWGEATVKFRENFVLSSKNKTLGFPFFSFLSTLPVKKAIS